MKLKLKELEAKTMSPCKPYSKSVGFDISKHIQFIPPFQKWENDKYFQHFEEVATSLEWPWDVWILLLQCTGGLSTGDLCSLISRPEIRM